MVFSGSLRYRISGTRGTVTYLSFGTYAGSRPGEGSMAPGHIDSSHLKLSPDGSFTVRVVRNVSQAPRNTAASSGVASGVTSGGYGRVLQKTVFCRKQIVPNLP